MIKFMDFFMESENSGMWRLSVKIFLLSSGFFNDFLRWLPAGLCCPLHFHTFHAGICILFEVYSPFGELFGRIGRCDLVGGDMLLGA